MIEGMIIGFMIFTFGMAIGSAINRKYNQLENNQPEYLKKRITELESELGEQIKIIRSTGGRELRQLNRIQELETFIEAKGLIVP